MAIINSFCILCVNSSVHTKTWAKSCIHMYFLVVWTQHRKVRWLILNRDQIMPSHTRPNQNTAFPVSSGWSVRIPVHFQLIRRWHHSFKTSYLLKGSVPFQPSFPPLQRIKVFNTEVFEYCLFSEENYSNQHIFE